MSAEIINGLFGVVVASIAAFAAIKASKAEKNSRPVSNGFAGHVLASLHRIETRMDSHIDNHD